MADTTNDPISWQKWLSGIGNIKNFLKIGCYGINILLLVLIVSGGMFLWNKFNPKKLKTPQQLTSNLTIQSGATVGHLDVNPTTDDAKKRTVGLQISATSEDASVGLVKYLNESWSVVLGARWAYEKPDDGDSQVLPEVKVQYDFY